MNRNTIFGIILVIISGIFLGQAFGGLDLIPVYQVFAFLGLARNPWVMIIFVFVSFWLFSLFTEKMKQEANRNEKNQNKANSLGRSFLISFFTLWFALFVFLLVERLPEHNGKILLPLSNLAQNDFFLNLYLFWFFLFSGLIGNIFMFRTVTNPQEEEKIMDSLKDMVAGRKSFKETAEKLKEIDEDNNN
ncbi:MAG: hypothetical protein AAB791_01470 [Patescibacteria group bacterium]